MHEMRPQLIKLAKRHFASQRNDPSHDFDHALRVLQYAERINKEEKAD